MLGVGGGVWVWGVGGWGVRTVHTSLWHDIYIDSGEISWQQSPRSEEHITRMAMKMVT